MSRIAIYPGTFDPITNGHLDLLVRATKIFDRVVIAVANNPRKNPLFSVEERISMIQVVSGDIANIEVEPFDDLLVNYVGRKNANFVIRGLRAVSDFDMLRRKLLPSGLLKKRLKIASAIDLLWLYILLINA